MTSKEIEEGYVLAFRDAGATCSINCGSNASDVEQVNKNKNAFLL